MEEEVMLKKGIIGESSNSGGGAYAGGIFFSCAARADALTFVEEVSLRAEGDKAFKSINPGMLLREEVCKAVRAPEEVNDIRIRTGDDTLPYIP